MANKFFTALFVVLAGVAQAEDVKTLEITAYNRVGDWLELVLADTAAGSEVICVLYDKDGRPVKTETGLTTNLATTVLVRIEGISVDSALCAYN